MTPAQIQSADNHLKEEYGAKRQTDWTATHQKPTTFYAEFIAGQNTLIARFDLTTGLLGIFRFDTGLKLP